MSKTRLVDTYWDDFYETVPDWDGPTHSRPGPPRGGMLRRKPVCNHWRQPVDLSEGVTVFASAWLDRPAKRQVDLEWADVALYLDVSWAQVTMMCSPGFRPSFARYRPARVLLYPWPDQGAPLDPARFRRALRWVLKQASEGQRVEIGCLAAHGRTGTALAGLLVLQGMSPQRAIAKIRNDYCEEAIETRAQTQMLHGLAKMR